MKWHRREIVGVFFFKLEIRSNEFIEMSMKVEEEDRIEIRLKSLPLTQNSRPIYARINDFVRKICQQYSDFEHRLLIL